MKIYLTAENEKGKQESIGGNEYLDMDIKIGNNFLARLTVRKDEDGIFKLFDENDTEIKCREPQKIYNSNKDTLLCVKRGCRAIQGETEYCEEHEKGKTQKTAKDDNFLCKCRCHKVGNGIMCQECLFDIKENQHI